MPVKRRPCSKCGKNRAEKFYTSTRGRVCSTCRRSSARAGARDARLQATYGITQAEYEQRLAKQGGKCAICGGTRRTNLDVDHDHAKERAGIPTRDTIRGLLCRRCNKLLASVRDKPEVLRAAAEYLERWAA